MTRILLFVGLIGLNPLWALSEEPSAPSAEGLYLHTAPLASGDQGVVEFAVPCKIEREIVDGIEYTTTWVGNQVIEILPRGRVSPLPF